MADIFFQEQNQEQNQIQEQLKLSSLNGWLTALSELDEFESIPISFELAKFCTGKLLSSIDNCITQTLAPVKQVTANKNNRVSDSLRKRFIIRILEWQSLRKKEYDIIDELCPKQL